MDDRAEGVSLFLEHLVQGGLEMIQVRVVQGFVAVESSVGIYQINYRNVACAVFRPELSVGVLEYRNGNVELVDEQTDVVFLDAAPKAYGYAGKAGGFVQLNQILNAGNMTLAVGALGAEVVYEQGALAEMAEQDARVANARQWL